MIKTKHKLVYPTNKAIDGYVNKIIEHETGKQMPVSVGQACSKIVAGLEILMGYYSRYQLFMQSTQLPARDLLIKHLGTERWESWPQGIRNKIIKRFEEKVQGMHAATDDMMVFLDTQLGFMKDMSDLEYEKIVELHEEFE